MAAAASRARRRCGRSQAADLARPRDDQRARSRGRTVGPSGAPTPPFHFIEEHATGSQPMRVGARRARAGEWRVKWGARSPHRNVRHAAGVGARILRRADLFRRRRARSSGAHDLQPREGLHRRTPPLPRGAIRADRRAWRRQTLRRARLGVERQPVRRHARAERPEDPDDAGVELGQQGRARRGARIEHRDLRIPDREARSARHAT